MAAVFASTARWLGMNIQGNDKQRSMLRKISQNPFKTRLSE